MKRWKSLTAALCAAVLLCGFSAVPAFAYADGGEGENYGDPTMTEETTAPEPEPTIEPGEGFSEEGNLVTRDLLYDEHTNKQFITVQTAGGNTFYIVIDYDKPVDEEGEQYACSVVASPERTGTEWNRSQKHKRTIIFRKEEIRCKKLSATRSAGRSLKSKLPAAERKRSMTKWCGSSAQKPSQMLTKTTKHGIIRKATCLSGVHYRRNEP